MTVNATKGQREKRTIGDDDGDDNNGDRARTSSVFWGVLATLKKSGAGGIAK